MKVAIKKYISILLSILLLIGMNACKKVVPLATYHCAMHNIVFGPVASYNSDTIVGYADISIYQSGTQVTINNETLNQTSDYNGMVTYTSPTPSAYNPGGSYYDNAVFSNNFDSIVYLSLIHI